MRREACGVPRRIAQSFARWAARDSLRNSRRASRICGPYVSVLRSPNPKTWRTSDSERGNLRHRSSSEESCITTYAGTDWRLAVVRRHSRKNSRNSGSIFVPALAATAAFPAFDDRLCAGSACAGTPCAFACSDLGASLSHARSQPQTSHAWQDSHFVFSPKCAQIWRCRQLDASTNVRIS